jgi:crotonobetainyl-CoA:carnitine CoA-transferase CaiB-like acyl-CoA transferase
MPSLNNTGDKPMPLEGIRVVEYGVFHAGPGASAILGDLGAEVIKIEEGKGDPERYWTETGGFDFAMPNGESIMHQISNRNKKGIWLDIKKEKGRKVLNRLVEASDVFVTNLRQSTKAALGIEYAAISEINPRIIHANVSGYGPEGPMSDYGAFDPLGQAQSGMMFVTGSEEPILLNLAVLDQTTAIAASHAILTALLHRERAGVGQELHISLYGTGIWFLYTNMVMNGCLSVPQIAWDRSKHSPLRNAFRCKDGKWIVTTHHLAEKYWPILCEVTGRSDLPDDPRFVDSARRRENCPDLIAIFDEIFAAKARDEWMGIFRAHGLLFSPAQQIEDVLNDPQALVNGYVVDFEHPALGKVKVPGYPVYFGANRADTCGVAPAIGEHTDLIMDQMGYSGEEIQVLKREGIIRASDRDPDP